MTDDPMETALLLIRCDACEKVWGSGYACITDTSLRPDAEHTAFRWCNSCIAHHGLRFSKHRNVRAIA